MIQVETIQELRSIVKRWKRENKTVGFVPTMGYLHEGHRSLMETAKKETDHVIVSIFVNPLQFGPNEDYEKYPRNLQHDFQLAASVSADVLFTPTVSEMYPVPIQTSVEVKGITDVMCGASRPGHFSGVATVVTKLFQITQADRAYFGQKDFQQVAVIKTMVRDLNIPIEIIPCPIVRESDGLALSSRNVYLSSEERQQALSLNKSLQLAQRMAGAGERDASTIRAAVLKQIQEQPLARIDYVEIRDPETFQSLTALTGTGLLALAVRFGNTRLIDNCLLEAPPL
ncbi:pantoate--beta-alanine ligase [Fodinisporobacter ferrooxydans]|uniref:Pantothenate synthetase n=1 Tax=Fodinisporobacter ferrooxydans TaxID=2901836 RepID=A0ABY4CSE6_9BACL|nr:pantoate--beta-alanine ligase [Alicyclobacillaceae bacterium MYW30-H2]